MVALRTQRDARRLYTGVTVPTCRAFGAGHKSARARNWAGHFTATEIASEAWGNPAAEVGPPEGAEGGGTAGEGNVGAAGAGVGGGATVGTESGWTAEEAVVGTGATVGTPVPELVDDELVVPAELLPKEDLERLDGACVATGIGVGIVSDPVAEPVVEDEPADPAVEGPIVGAAGEAPVPEVPADEAPTPGPPDGLDTAPPMTPLLVAPGLPPPVPPPAALPATVPGDPVGPGPVPPVAGPPASRGTGVGTGVGEMEAGLAVGMGVGFVDVAPEDPACLLLRSAPSRRITATASTLPRTALRRGTGVTDVPSYDSRPSLSHSYLQAGAFGKVRAMKSSICRRRIPFFQPMQAGGIGSILREAHAATSRFVEDVTPRQRGGSWLLPPTWLILSLLDHPPLAGIRHPVVCWAVGPWLSHTDNCRR